MASQGFAVGQLAKSSLPYDEEPQADQGHRSYSWIVQTPLGTLRWPYIPPMNVVGPGKKTGEKIISSSIA
jgi:hypothetical protein